MGLFSKKKEIICVNFIGNLNGSSKMLEGNDKFLPEYITIQEQLDDMGKKRGLSSKFVFPSQWRKENIAADVVSMLQQEMLTYISEKFGKDSLTDFMDRKDFQFMQIDHLNTVIYLTSFLA